MKIVSWNVNSIRVRIEHLCFVARKYQPDIFLLQETRVDDRLFPTDCLDELGYNMSFRGEKARNGVAIFSKHLIEDVKTDFCDEARYIEAFTGGVYVASVYVPNGRAVGADHYYYKLDFLRDLEERLTQMRNETFIVGGDFNVAPYAKDACEEVHLDDLLCCSPKEREAVEKLRKIGFSDPLHDKGFTWWDYRFGAFKRNIGLRIDQFYLSSKANDLFLGGDVLKDIRALPKPSDHAPILCELKL
ncbi:MAG: exodeoxyribonuclease III [Alphaproteobacteria bacterium]|nr:exodeoxyribonuclease III [Alphaproteobacteria bacterium]